MPIDAAALAKLETVLTAAVKACLGLPADDRVGFIARYSVSFSFGHYSVHKTSRVPFKYLGPLYMMK
jgi:hypothetical protein